MSVIEIRVGKATNLRNSLSLIHLENLQRPKLFSFPTYYMWLDLKMALKLGVLVNEFSLHADE